MNCIKSLIILFSTIAFIASSCHKNNDPDPDSFYFRCKVDGQDYRPNGCTNCITCTIYKDTIFLLGGNRGFEVVSIGIINLDGNPIVKATYILDERPNQSGIYKNSTTVNEKFQTNTLYTGQLVISSLDKSKQTISGFFSFQAYNPVQDKSVNITDGKFRLEYTTN